MNSLKTQIIDEIKKHIPDILIKPFLNMIYPYVIFFNILLIIIIILLIYIIFLNNKLNKYII